MALATAPLALLLELAVVVVALVGVNRITALRAHLRFWHRHPAAAIAKTCDGNMTVDECQALLKDKLQDLKDKVQQAAQKKYEECLQQKSKDYCDGRLDQFKADHPRVYGNATAS